MRARLGFVLRSIMAAIAVAVSLTVTTYGANAAEFTDIANSKYLPAIEYVASNGYMGNTGNMSFSPNTIMTTGDFILAMTRATNGRLVEKYYTNMVGSHLDRTNNLVMYLWSNGVLTDCYDIRSQLNYNEACNVAFELTGTEAFSNSLFNQESTGNANFDTAVREGFIPNIIGLYDKVTRELAADLIHRIMTNTDGITKPNIVGYVNGIWDSGATNISDFFVELSKVPQPVLDRFNNLGWTFSISPAYIADWGSANGGIIATGLCDPANKTIYMKLPKSVVHEFGHFDMNTSGVWGDQVNNVYLTEAKKLESLLGRYSQTNYREFYAELFDYWVKNAETEHNKLKSISPKAYELMIRQEERWRA